MSDIIKAIILSIVEGLTEFLPISSTGHLILVNHWIEFKGSFANTFDVIIQFGAILSVVLLYWPKLYPFKKSKRDTKNAFKMWYKVLIAFIPAMIFGALLSDTIEEHFFNPITVAIMLVLGGFVIIILENRKKIYKFESIDDMSYKTAFFIGLFQCLAMIPGTSRSAATIIGAMLLGSSRKAAAEFSFFLAVPTMAAATVYSILKKGIYFNSSELLILLLGVFVSFIVALAVITVFMNYIKKKDFKLFAYYRIILGVFILSSVFIFKF